MIGRSVSANSVQPPQPIGGPQRQVELPLVSHCEVLELPAPNQYTDFFYFFRSEAPSRIRYRARYYPPGRGRSSARLRPRSRQTLTSTSGAPDTIAHVHVVPLTLECGRSLRQPFS